MVLASGEGCSPVVLHNVQDMGEMREGRSKSMCVREFTCQSFYFFEKRKRNRERVKEKKNERIPLASVSPSACLQ